MLLRLRDSTPAEPVWFVVEQSEWSDTDTLRYWVEESTCPTNVVRIPAILTGTGADLDADPHGVFEFVAWAPKPAGWGEPDATGDCSVDWRTLFPQLAGSQRLLGSAGEGGEP
ncbi:hypothetical protein M0638_25295 [Roseomonas sp. NAR14]|uniref:Uncharacterized protein n=1 Tax=Roseomonas acroporae TaxID=2937791 RepID=A0A9X1YDA7_9PROT|nr:hypothetical protein [Roseomonas acroporae]MCK8787687.1 hypothetical protein [Roseomonas acroporae]